LIRTLGVGRVRQDNSPAPLRRHIAALVILAGTATAGGVETTNGEVHSVTGDVTYSVSASRNASGTVTWSTGFTSPFKFYLDDVDTAPETNIAYHATALFWSANTGISGQGSLTRRYRKFN